MSSIPITPDLNYKLELPDGEYYPVMLDIFNFDDRGKSHVRKNGWAGLFFYFPNSNGTLSLRFRDLEMDYLKHINFKNLNEESPRVFIEEGLLKLIDCGNVPNTLRSKIKNASEIKDSNKYFNLFDPKIEDCINTFSEFETTPL